MSGSAVKSHGWPKGWRQLNAKTDNFVHLVVPGLSTNSGSISSSTSTLQELSSASPAQERSDEQVPRRWRGSPPQKPQTKIKRGMAVEMRATVCEIFLNGWRSSQIILRTQKCMHPHTFLRTQIRNVPRKWYQNQNQGSTVLKLTSHKTEIAKSACEPKWQGLLAEDALAKFYLEQKSLVTW